MAELCVNDDQAPDDRAPVVDAKARDAALRLLGRREYSSAEMRRKLVSRGHTPPCVDAVLHSLRDEQLLCDDRFAESFVRMRVERGQGPVRIRAELRERGVSDTVIDQVTTHTGEFWLVHARRIVARRYGRADLVAGSSQRITRDDWNRRARFLAQRGFPSDLIYRALGAEDD